MRNRLRAALATLAFLTALPALAADITGPARILDGDTVEIGATRVRIQGIDAPETDQV